MKKDPFDYDLTICDYCSVELAIEELVKCPTCDNEMCEECVDVHAANGCE